MRSLVLSVLVCAFAQCVGGPSRADSLLDQLPADASTPHTDASESVSTAHVGARSSAHSPELTPAFFAAFGQNAPATVIRPADKVTGRPAQALAYRPDRLIRLSSKVWVLISDGTIENGDFMEEGSLSVHYLRREGGSFQAIGKWLNIGGSAPYGRAASWVVRHDLESHPVIWTTSEGSDQGCAWIVHDWISLLPDKARLSAGNLLTSSKYEGPDSGSTADTQWVEESWKTVGTVRPHRLRQDFDIVYKGHNNLTVHFPHTADGYSDAQAKAARVGC